MWEMVPIGTWPKNRDRLGHTGFREDFWGWIWGVIILLGG